MSTTIDNRVLEMRFDNKQFESGVATSMSTLDKLKQKLNLSGASKGLENVGKVAKGISFTGMTAGISQVKAGMMSIEGISAGVIAKFSVINNLCNSLFHTGKRMVSALTIDPVRTGFQEYETQIGAIQTILANTQKEGTNVEIVNRALDELNTYADKTIYNFTEMTRNIGTFTAAGVKLDTSVNAIKGIANLAAISGSTSQQASTAMYQLSQALAAGKVQLMDWNSVVNAGMGGQVFQDALIRTSELLGTGAKASIDAYGSFRESLTEGAWLTTEVLTETLNQFAGAYSKADLMNQGFTEQQANDILKMAQTAEDAATKVKTFSQLWDTMKEAVQSGWGQTWRILFGDFEEAKELFTGLSDFFGGFINKFSEARNKLLEGALATNIRKMFDGIDESLNTLLKPIDKVKESFTDIGKVVDDVILGKFGNGQERFDSLTESGYNWMKVQNKVNETLQNGFRYTDKQIAEQDKLIGSQKKTAEVTGETAEEVRELTNSEKERIKTLGSMSEAALRNLGYSEEQINAIKTLKGLSDKLGISFNELIDNMDNINGRWLIIDSFKNIGASLVKIFSSIGAAWENVFEPVKPEQIFNAVAAVHKFTESLVLSDETAKNLQSTFKGLFAALDIISTIAGGGLKLGFEVLSSILGAFDLSILDVTGAIGEAIFSFRNWLFEENKIAKAFDGLVAKLPSAVGKLKEWFDAFKEIPEVEGLLTAIDNIKEAFSNFSFGEIDLTELAQTLGTNLANALLSLPEMMVQIGRDVITGFRNGIEEGLSGTIIGKIISFCAEFIAAFASALGCHSPSVITHEIGVNTIQGFINGINEMLAPVLAVIKYIGEQIINAFKFIWDLVTDESGNIEWDKVFAGGMLVLGLKMIKQFVNAIDGIADGIGGIGDILEGAGDALKSFSKVLNGFAWDLKAKAIQKIAISIAILAAAIYALSTIEDPTQLWHAVGVIGALAAIVLALAGAMELMSKASLTYEKGKLNIEGLKASILQIGATLLMLGIVVKIIGEMNPDQAKAGFIALTSLMVEVIAFMAIVGHVVKGGAAENISEVGKLMTKLAIAMLLMTAVVKLASGLSGEEMLKGAAFATAFGLFVVAITSVAKSAGNNVSKVGGMILKITTAMGLMIGVIKLVSLLSPGEMLKGAAFATAFGIFVSALVKVTKIGKKQQIAKLGGLLMSISVSLLLMVGVCKLVGTLSASEIIKGVAFVGAFLIFLNFLIKITSTGQGEIAKVGSTMMALSVSVGILAGVCALLGILDIASLAKGIVAVGLLSGFMTMMVKALKGAQNVQKSIMKLAISIGVMALAITALSLIDTADLASATIALGTLMGMFALMEKSMSGLKNIKAGPILSMILVIGAMTGAIYLLRNIQPESAISSAIALSTLLIATSTAMLILGNMTTIAGDAVKGALALTAMAVPLAAFAITLRLMSGIDGAIEKATALTILAGVATVLALAVVGIGAVIGMTGGTAVVPIIMGLVAIATPLLVLVGILKTMEGIDNASENVNLLTKMMNSMVKTLTVLAIIGPLALVGVGAMAGLTILMGAIGTMAVAVGALVDTFPSIQKFLDTGLPILEQLAGSIGTMIGKFIGGIGEGLSDSLPAIGHNITLFMANLSAASAAASGIKAESFDGVFGLCESLLAVGGTSVGMSIADALVGAFTGNKDATAMEKFKDDAVAFFTALKNISGSMVGFSLPENFSANSVMMLIDVIKMVSKTMVGTSLTDVFTKAIGDKTAMKKFEDDGKAFFTALKNISSTMTGFTLPENFSSEDITTLIGAIKNVSSTAVNTSFKDIFTKLIGDKTAIKKFESDGKAFFTALKNISGSMVGFTLPEGFSTDGVTTLIDAIKNISNTAVNTSFKDVFTKLIGDKTAMNKFEDDGKAFFTAMKNIAATATGLEITDGAFDSVIAAAKKLGELQTELAGLTEVVDFFIEREDLGTFGTKIDLFATAMGKLKTGMGENGISEGVVTSVINAGNAIIALQEALPEEGWFDGKMNLEEFSEYVKKFSDAMTTFSTDAASIGSEGINTAITAAYRIKDLITALAGLDTSGVNSFSGVGYGDGSLVNIGQAIGEFGESVSDIDTTKVSTAVSTALSLKNLIQSLVGLDASGIENFKIDTIGKAIQGYGNSVQNIDPGIVSSSISSANRLKTFITGLAGLDPSGIVNFKIDSLGRAISAYAVSIAGLDYGSISTSISSMNQLKSFISGLSGFDASGVESFKSAVSSLAQTNISGITSAFNESGGQLSGIGTSLVDSLTSGFNSNSNSLISAASDLATQTARALEGKSGDFLSAGTEVMGHFVDGIESKEGSAESAAESVSSSAASSSGNSYYTFYNMGSYVASGFVAGISDNIQAAANAAASMASAASAAARANLSIHSPSRVFMKIGSYVPKGFAKGIGMFGGLVKRSVSRMSDTAVNSTQMAMLRISSLLDEDINTQPTIRPVLDLSDIKSGAGAINGMLNGTPTLETLSKLNTIHSMMGERSQNGTMDDVIYAINKLRKDIGNIGGPQYNIGGITYDDGSNIAEVVQMLIRAAKIERRI